MPRGDFRVQEVLFKRLKAMFASSRVDSRCQQRSAGIGRLSAPHMELFPYRAPAAATWPCRAFMNKPYPFPSSYLISFLMNLTHVTRSHRTAYEMMRAADC